MAAVLSDFVPPWRATCFRGFLGGGFPGGVSLEQPMQTAAVIGDVQKHNGSKGTPHTVGDPVSLQKTGSYSETISGSNIGIEFQEFKV